jgi:cbb3-type cytochrome oxidase maturation protein
MDNWVIAMMLGASIFLGAIALFAFLWAIKNGQFDDEEKFLNDAKKQEEKKESLKKSYRPE